MSVSPKARTVPNTCGSFVIKVEGRKGGGREEGREEGERKGKEGGREEGAGERKGGREVPQWGILTAG